MLILHPASDSLAETTTYAALAKAAAPEDVRDKLTVVTARTVYEEQCKAAGLDPMDPFTSRKFDWNGYTMYCVGDDFTSYAVPVEVRPRSDETLKQALDRVGIGRATAGIVKEALLRGKAVYVLEVLSKQLIEIEAVDDRDTNNWKQGWTLIPV
jgi:hypothetical protein